ncbi:MAG TPA: TonB C-terminal domain-containing protein [Gemmatimonadaceae bacterium]|nr:TonB C-terminal domain-containing protein [Gemmatimonadaceae bacterium]
MSHAQQRPSLTLPMGASILFHAAAITALIVYRPAPGPALPPVYRVQLIAAPAGPRQEGVVRDNPPAKPADTKPPPPKVKPKPEPAPTVTTKAETPTKAPPKPQQVTPSTEVARHARVTSRTATAGGGPEGGTGSDVANVSTPGIDFPFPGYVKNIVRQVAERWNPPDNSALAATVVFLVHRDGSVTDFRFQKRSGSFAFDLAAQGAVDAAGTAKAFGPLPGGYPDDVLPVIFTFDPRIIH